MNIRVARKTGAMIIYCHECDSDIDISDLVQRADRLHCRECNIQLGFMKDLDPQYHTYVIKER